MLTRRQAGSVTAVALAAWMGVAAPVAIAVPTVPGALPSDISEDGGEVELGAEQGGSNGDSGSDGSPGSVVSSCQFQGRVIPCSAETGSWSSSEGCYVSRAPQQPVPPPTTTGAAYLCTIAGSRRLVWIEGTPPTGPDPAVLARQVVETIATRPIDIGIVPEPGDNRMGLIGMPTWMWVADPGPNTMGPVSDSASVGTTSVTATGRVTSITWNMGDGSSVNCHGPGTRYTDAASDSDSPDCGHRYQQTSKEQPGGKYRVTATAHWEFTWQETGGGGQSGVITFDQESSAVIRIGELQVLVRRG